MSLFWRLWAFLTGESWMHCRLCGEGFNTGRCGYVVVEGWSPEVGQREFGCAAITPSGDTLGWAGQGISHPVCRRCAVGIPAPEWRRMGKTGDAVYWQNEWATNRGFVAGNAERYANGL